MMKSTRQINVDGGNIDQPNKKSSGKKPGALKFSSTIQHALLQ